ncbi:GNAT family N-acetyltransferase [Pilimelia anulata]|uniref:GNAT family N-acetyltransferase n=1 Tax=Pilimelia anulata TaxID=53371 RepID=UPI001668DA30|nr:GNAT family N-acetyltransferase [Pilimelia anulata]
MPGLIADGAIWVLEDADTMVGTITLETSGDPDFWTPTELAEPALYLSKLATLPSRAGEELGALLLDWACDHAYRRGVPEVRLDAWRTNPALHDYYRHRGWTYLRTEVTPGRQSGALFVRAARPMPLAAADRLNHSGLVAAGATAPCSPDVPNEDRYAVGRSWAFVLDGAGRYPGRTGGCVHPIPWLVDRLSHHLAGELDREDDRSLSAVLAATIAATCADHADTCDLSDPLSPGAAVAVVRQRAGVLEWLVLGDCAVVLDPAELEPVSVVDDRVDRLADAPVTDAEVRTYHPDYVAQVRNQPGGFWVAAAVAAAAEHAYTGQLAARGVRQALVASDGVTRLVERHGWSWRRLLDTAAENGSRALIDAVRQADEADPDPRRWRGKRHDDATVIRVLCGGQTT